MNKICWDFPLLGTGNETGSKTAAITMFRGAGSSYMDGLVREVCQNSLDAKNKDIDEEIPVKVVFSEVNIKKNDYSEIFDEFKKYVDAAEKYWESKKLVPDDLLSFLQQVKNCLEQESLPMLVMSDFNTTGLNGVNANDDEESFWNRLVNSEGISWKPDKGSAGSYGVGKNAPFGYSGMNMVFYNTLAQDGSRGFEGVSRLVTTTREHEGKQRATVAIGKYLYLVDFLTGRAIVPEDNCKFAQNPVFKRGDHECGTDVAIVGFRKELFDDEGWEAQAVVAALKNFILAIMAGKLSFEVITPKYNCFVNKNNLRELLFEEFKENAELTYTRQIYETISEPDLKESFEIRDEKDLTIYVKYKESYRQVLSKFRSIGMLVSALPGGSRPHFSVVQIVNATGKEELTTLVKDAEPPQHNEWKSTNAIDMQRGKEIKTVLGMMSRRVNECIEKCDTYDVDEIMDAGVGAYLPNSALEESLGVGSDGMKQNIKIADIRDNEGRIIYSAKRESGEGATGDTDTKQAHLRGKRKHKKKTNKKIKVVKPKKSEKTKGVSVGEGKIEIEIPEITEHRTYLLAQDRYRLFVKCPEDYKNVILRYRVGRDDGSDEGIEIKSIKQKGMPLVNVNGSKAGPICLDKGTNEIIVEFSETGRKALTASFTMEVRNEE